MQDKKLGSLYIVATPLGNLQDITLRALTILKKVDRIGCEDTRHSSALLQHFAIKKPIFSLHAFNEQEATAKLLSFLQKGESIALMSDAGTPLIADPGFYLIREAAKIGMKIIPVPGPCALIAALSVSDLPLNRFCFEGFLPAKAGARKKALMTLAHETRTMVFYEAPHRILKTLEDMSDIFGRERRVLFAREMTKMHENFLRGTLASLLDIIRLEPNEQRGEMVLVVAGIEQDTDTEKERVTNEILAILLKELPLKQAVRLTCRMTLAKKNDLYQTALKKNLIDAGKDEKCD